MGGDQLVDTLRRIAISQRRDLYRIGVRFFMTENMRRATASENFGSYTHAHEKGDCVLLGVFAGNREVGSRFITLSIRSPRGNHLGLSVNFKRCRIGRRYSSDLFSARGIFLVDGELLRSSRRYIVAPLKHTMWNLSTTYGKGVD